MTQQLRTIQIPANAADHEVVAQTVNDDDPFSVFTDGDDVFVQIKDNPALITAAPTEAKAREIMRGIQTGRWADQASKKPTMSNQ